MLSISPSFVPSPQLGDRRMGSLQPLLWRRSADQASALPEEGHLPEGGGSSSLPLPHRLSSADSALPNPGLPARMEHWVLVSGGFVGLSLASVVAAGSASMVNGW